jgi:hypothetical protein
LELLHGREGLSNLVALRLPTRPSLEIDARVAGPGGLEYEMGALSTRLRPDEVVLNQRHQPVEANRCRGLEFLNVIVELGQATSCAVVPRAVSYRPTSRAARDLRRLTSGHHIFGFSALIRMVTA